MFNLDLLITSGLHYAWTGPDSVRASDYKPSLLRMALPAALKKIAVILVVFRGGNHKCL